MRNGSWTSGADTGTNLKVGGAGHIRREAPENLSCAPSLFQFFFGPTSTIGDRFCDGQYSLVSFLLAVFLLSVPFRDQPFCKSVGGGGRAPMPHRVGAGK